MLSFHDGRVVLHEGSCLDVLDALAENSIDSCCTDPPYHLTSIVKRFGGENAAPAQEGTDGAFARSARGFMGKQWDGGDVAFQPETWAKVLRVLKPGAYLVAFSSSRTFGRMSVAIEDAGFVTHPMIGWLFATGFPKATRVKADGYDGFRYGGQALKPALEPIYVGQKPFSEETGTANILRWGTGAVNIDACRVEGSFESGWSKSGSKASQNVAMSGANYEREPKPDSSLGRWPANLIHDGSPEVLAGFPDVHGAGSSRSADEGTHSGPSGMFGLGEAAMRFGDSGSAARFFASFPQDEKSFWYSGKADADDRLGSKHPTVKPVDLLRWLVRLVTPPRGLVLDPFAGTGTTGHAALIEGMRAILIEREPEYREDIARRMGLVFAGQDERKGKTTKQDEHGSLPLFGGLE